MRLKFKSLYQTAHDLLPAVNFLDQNLGKMLTHNPESKKYFYVGKNWRIENHQDFYAVVFHKEHLEKSWYKEFESTWIAK